jgi:hypothetical protein
VAFCISSPCIAMLSMFRSTPRIVSLPEIIAIAVCS